MIIKFKQSYDYLTNFYDKTSFEYKGIKWNSAEAAFQGMKSHSKDEWVRFSKMTPSQSKFHGRRVDLSKSWGSSAEWNKVAPEIMYEIVKAKFGVEANKRLLLSTGTEYLIEGTGGPGFSRSWSDYIWGVCRCSKCIHKIGKNLLGNILMRVRAELSGEEYDRQFESIAPYAYTSVDTIGEVKAGDRINISSSDWSLTQDGIVRSKEVLICAHYLPCEDLGNKKIKSLRESFEVLSVKHVNIDGRPKVLLNIAIENMG